MGIIDVQNVSMRFNLAREKTDTIKEYVLKMLRRQLSFSEFYALRDVSFSIEKGESVALIGSNGSGKSTMLKLISGVMYPTQGSIEVNGTIAPLIELGAGFDMDLTARENIFLNGAILGYDRAFMRSHFDEIVDFAELHDFVDVPVKNYSSGMRARLGFAIATAVDPQVLILDEVLSVGDAKFKKKSEAKIMSMFDKGVTVLFVSHNTAQVRRLCTKAILLEKGRVIASGTADEVCDIYDSKVKTK